MCQTRQDLGMQTVTRPESATNGGLGMTMKTRKEMNQMCIRAIRRIRTKAEVAADCERYRRYAEAKARIPMNLSPREYEEEVKRLARVYRI